MLPFQFAEILLGAFTSVGIAGVSGKEIVAIEQPKVGFHEMKYAFDVCIVGQLVIQPCRAAQVPIIVIKAMKAIGPEARDAEGVAEFVGAAAES